MSSPGSDELLTDILRDVSRSFYLTLRVLPRAVRRQIGLAYLLARTTDTVADTDVAPTADRVNTLRALRGRIAGTSNEPLKLGNFTGGQASNGERVLLTRVEESLSLLNSFDAPDRHDIISVLETITLGQEQDLARFSGASEGEIRALETPADLDNYTYLVAGCVGEFWTRICRRHLFPTAPIDESQLLVRGVRFGKGLQLVNILRDIPSDLRAGRCYLPAEQLAAIGMHPSDLLEQRNFANVRPVYVRWLNIAEEHLREGWAYTNSLPYGHMRTRLACAWPLMIGFETLGLLGNQNILDPGRRVKISRSRVKALILKSIVRYPFPTAWERMIP